MKSELKGNQQLNQENSNLIIPNINECEKLKKGMKI